MEILKTAHKGLIGESLVTAKLLEHGWDTANINSALKNFKYLDLVCVNGSKYRGIQVKTSYNKNAHVGFTLEEACSIDKLKEKIIGPWVFVFATDWSKVKSQKGQTPHTEQFSYEYYILTKEETINLIYTTNKWYVDRKREKPLVMSAVCGVDKDWFVTHDIDTPHGVISQSIMEEPKDNWEKIWK